MSIVNKSHGMEFSSSSSSDSSSSEEAIMVLAALPTPSVFRVPKDPFEQYNDTEFQLRYRVRKHTVRRLCYLIGNYITPETHRKNQ